MNTKQKGDLAELKVMSDLVSRGKHVAIPFGDAMPFDVIVYDWVNDMSFLKRVQVKYVDSKGDVILLKCFSSTHRAGHTYTQKLYSQREVDYMAVYDVALDQCFYVPISEVWSQTLRLRHTAPKNGQSTGIRWAKDFQMI